MQRIILTYLITSALLTTGCSIQDQVANREDRLIGTWVIDRAVFDEDGALFNTNVTDEYAGDEVVFYPDGTVEYFSGDGRFFSGPWFLDALRDLDDDVEFTLDADFFLDSGVLAFRWSGTIQKLTNNNFNLNVPEVDGTLRLRWDKVD
ncbi:hypothetical protein [Neolewinella antarctica]|uniref:Lipocalin-like domain-containing protein n=1 Tax=Neolewinella antarctica TaxID=442734 RepID=A0ABX0XB10_9BACT|nr:hypothetical protein [Neolewinella antarctica]NJC26430.1 hypothetical protein [Neolewinella antarctica]